ncbi:unnamed protein product [Rotaria sp. Silwood1]|nr:unnamed protein product [Rotaria sp. Silwood1]CAF1561679.1 unnamed protein product [Rotaria sp. Silwood1]CAF3682479.1 unnamed protein product [Rotaria sp. Silwood1]CAF4856610.1 unnamed protein product [Rotaria sp. Silwood1]CAF4885457.1 unnamed protein product [Rotaria sp. Silwood1]
MVLKLNSSSINLSLAGCGFLGVYHIGVVCAFKEHAPEVLNIKMAGCSAGALVAACAMSGCCLGQMCSDALEIAVRARSRALGPLHPTFSIVDIIRNGLRRILPPNAHELCSGRLFISLTRWKDNKNFIINHYHNREELIQVLICSSFVPYWSGIIPHKFRGEYYWDGGLTNNNPIIDGNTILVSPFAGESDICPRDESGSFYSIDFRGTDISCTQENLYRLTHALFPPSLSVLKEICWRGYIDGLKFLQTRNMIKSSHLSTKTTISSVLGSDYTEPANEEEKQLRNGGVLHDVDKMYEKSHDIDDKLIGSEYSSDEELEKLNNQINFSSFCEKITRKKDLPTPLFAVFADARQKVEDPIGRYFTESNVYKVWSLLTLPITLPIDLTYTTMKRIFGIFYPSSSNQSSNNTMNFFWSFFSENDDNYCYHVNDCECTESRISSHNYYHHHHHSYVQTYQRQISAPTNSWTSSSNESNDDDFLSVDNHHISVKQFNQSTITKEYCRHLQHMAKLSNQKQFKEKLIPIFNDDYHLIYNKTNKIPTTSLGRTLLFT